MTARRSVVLQAAVIIAVLVCCGSPTAKDAMGSSTDAARTTANTVVLTGVVRSAPTCPVEQPDSPCPPRPVDGALVEAAAGERLVGSTSTDSAGKYTLTLPAGTYTVRASTARPLPVPTTVTVSLTAATTLDLLLDSGIR